MHEIGINPIISTRFNVKNKKAKEQKFIHNNYLKYWQPDQPGTHFVTDMTYIYTREDGWVYLLTFMDLFTRQIVEFDVHDQIDVECVTKILERLVDNFPNAQLIHYDHGSQYKSKIHMQNMAKNDITQSCRKKVIHTIILGS